MWSQHGAHLLIREIEEFADPEFVDVKTTLDGKGDIPNAINHYYDGRPVLLFVQGISDSPDTYGVTANDRRGLVTWQADGNVVAHELGHVFIGLGHPELFGNLMMADLPDHIRPEILPWLNPGQVQIARNTITKKQWD